MDADFTLTQPLLRKLWPERKCTGKELTHPDVRDPMNGPVVYTFLRDWHAFGVLAASLLGLEPEFLTGNVLV